MPDLTEDPNLQLCPDFESTEFDAIRTALVATGNFTQDTVAGQLRDAWKNGNAKKVIWEQQLQRHRDAADAERQLREQEAEQVRIQAEKEAEAERKEAEKKKPKLADFDETRIVGDHIAIRPSPFAIKKLEEFSYIELYYFTPEGCADTADHQRVVAEDAFGITHAEDALALRPISALKPSRNVIKDIDLTWRQMEMGSNGLLEEMARSGWPEKHIKSLATFFYNLNRHPHRQLENGHGERILINYQARTRCEWHDALKKPGAAFNIALFNDNLLRSISDEYWNKVRSDGLKTVRAFYLTRNSLTCCFISSPPSY
ncbi:hypothetical protein C8F01DRAFT_998993 [Mycena amicta]|nr:hypothetical protein C8F01DRAFT_998993 [Mycena amicta]